MTIGDKSEEFEYGSGGWWFGGGDDKEEDTDEEDKSYSLKIGSIEESSTVFTGKLVTLRVNNRYYTLTLPFPHIDTF